MRIAFSLLAFRPGRISGGVETYLRKLLDRLPHQAGGDELLAIMDRDLAHHLPTPGFGRIVLPAGARRIVGHRLAEAFLGLKAHRLAREIDERVDVAIFPQQSVFPICIRKPSVLVVHDVRHLVSPEEFGLFDRTFRARAYPASLRRADRVIAISEVTRRDLAERCAVRPERVAVVPHGFDGMAAVAAPWDAGADYLLYPAATEPHKGHATLLRSFAALRKRGFGPPLLVFTGQRTPRWPELRRLARSLGIEKDVIHLGFLPAAELRSVYAGARAIVFPTRFEGFGLPVLEAVEHRKAVIVSRLPIFDELGVPRRWQIDFSDPEQLAAALTQPGPTELEKRPSTWDEVAARTLDIAREAARH